MNVLRQKVSYIFVVCIFNNKMHISIALISTLKEIEDMLINYFPKASKNFIDNIFLNFNDIYLQI